MLGQHGTEQAELGQHVGFAIGIGTHIHQYPVATVLFRDHAGNAGTDHPGDRFDAENAAHQHGPRVAGAGEGVQFAFLQQLEPQADAALGFGLQGLCGVVVEGDIIRAGDDIERAGVSAFG